MDKPEKNPEEEPGREDYETETDFEDLTEMGEGDELTDLTGSGMSPRRSTRLRKDTKPDESKDIGVESMWEELQQESKDLSGDRPVTINYAGLLVEKFKATQDILGEYDPFPSSILNQCEDMWELYVGLEYYDYVYYHAERNEKIVKKQIVKIQKDEATALLNTSRAHIIRLLGDTQQQKAAIANMLFLKSVLKPGGKKTEPKPKTGGIPKIPKIRSQEYYKGLDAFHLNKVLQVEWREIWKPDFFKMFNTFPPNILESGMLKAVEDLIFPAWFARYGTIDIKPSDILRTREGKEYSSAGKAISARFRSSGNLKLPAFMEGGAPAPQDAKYMFVRALKQSDLKYAQYVKQGRAAAPKPRKEEEKKDDTPTPTDPEHLNAGETGMFLRKYMGRPAFSGTPAEEARHYANQIMHEAFPAFAALDIPFDVGLTTTPVLQSIINQREGWPLDFFAVLKDEPGPFTKPRARARLMQYYGKVDEWIKKLETSPTYRKLSGKQPGGPKTPDAAIKIQKPVTGTVLIDDFLKDPRTVTPFDAPVQGIIKKIIKTLLHDPVQGVDALAKQLRKLTPGGLMEMAQNILTQVAGGITMKSGQNTKPLFDHIANKMFEQMVTQTGNFETIILKPQHITPLLALSKDPTFELVRNVADNILKFANKTAIDSEKKRNTGQLNVAQAQRYSHAQQMTNKLKEQVRTTVAQQNSVARNVAAERDSSRRHALREDYAQLEAKRTELHNQLQKYSEVMNQLKPSASPHQHRVKISQSKRDVSSPPRKKPDPTQPSSPGGGDYRRLQQAVFNSERRVRSLEGTTVGSDFEKARLKSDLDAEKYNLRQLKQKRDNLPPDQKPRPIRLRLRPGNALPPGQRGMQRPPDRTAAPPSPRRIPPPPPPRRRVAPPPARRPVAGAAQNVRPPRVNVQIDRRAYGVPSEAERQEEALARQELTRLMPDQADRDRLQWNRHTHRFTYIPANPARVYNMMPQMVHGQHRIQSTAYDEIVYQQPHPESMYNNRFFKMNPIKVFQRSVEDTDPISGTHSAFWGNIGKYIRIGAKPRAIHISFLTKTLPDRALKILITRIMEHTHSNQVLNPRLLVVFKRKGKKIISMLMNAHQLRTTDSDNLIRIIKRAMRNSQHFILKQDNPGGHFHNLIKDDDILL